MASLQAELSQQGAKVESAVAEALSRHSDALAAAVASKVEASLHKALEDAVAPKVQEAVDRAILQLSQAVGALPSAFGASISSSVTSTVSSTFQSHFLETLAPAYERASKAMYEQLHGSFSAGLAQFKQQTGDAIGDVVREAVGKAASAQESMLAKAVATHEKALTRSLQDAASKFDAASAVASAAGGGRKGGGGAQQPPPQQQQQQPPPPSAKAAAPRRPRPCRRRPRRRSRRVRRAARGGSGVMAGFAATMELQTMLSAGQVEKALITAISKDDLPVLVWLCGKLEPKSLHGPPPVNQVVLLMLVQKLSEQLGADAKLKLAWLKESLQLIKPRDAQIAGSVPQVLGALRGRLQDEAVLNALEGAGLAPDVAMVERIANKLLPREPRRQEGGGAGGGRGAGAAVRGRGRRSHRRPWWWDGVVWGGGGGLRAPGGCKGVLPPGLGGRVDACAGAVCEHVVCGGPRRPIAARHACRAI